MSVIQNHENRKKQTFHQSLLTAPTIGQALSITFNQIRRTSAITKAKSRSLHPRSSSILTVSRILGLKRILRPGWTKLVIDHLHFHSPPLLISKGWREKQKYLIAFECSLNRGCFFDKHLIVHCVRISPAIRDFVCDGCLLQMIGKEPRNL